MPHVHDILNCCPKWLCNIPQLWVSVMPYLGVKNMPQSMFLYTMLTDWPPWDLCIVNKNSVCKLFILCIMNILYNAMNIYW